MRQEDALIARMDAINRTRSLTDAEVDQLDAAIKRVQARDYRMRLKPTLKPAWSEQEDETVREALRRGCSLASAAALVGRSESAARCRFTATLGPGWRGFVMGEGPSA